MILKHIPEDFIVEEIPLQDFENDGQNLQYCIFRLEKIGMNTEKAVDIISRRFNISHSAIKYSGTKDRHARTIQYISIPKKSLHHSASSIQISEDDIMLKHAGYLDSPLSLGTLKGNKFTITVRELTSDEIKSLHHYGNSNHSAFFVPNYFDEQRFSKNNYDIGLNIVKGKYKDAVDIICSCDEKFSSDSAAYMQEHSNDYIGAIKKIPRKILMMFIHSVQSYIFNEALYHALKDHADSKDASYYTVDYSLGKLLYYRDIGEYRNIIESIEMPGFNTHALNHHVKRLMDEIGINQRSFIIKALPELSVEGTKRECLVEVQDKDVEIIGDHAIVRFFLTKGSYATIAMKGLVNY